MTNNKHMIMILVIQLIATCTASTQEGFKLESVPKNIAEKIGLQSHPVRDGLHPQFVKKKPVNSKWGILMEPFLAFAVCRTTPEGEFETVAFDTNQNQDLTDDEKYPIGKPFSAILPRLKCRQLIMRPSPLKKGVFILSPTKWYQGKIEVGEKSYETALVDMDLNGLGSKKDLVIFDSNENGSFSFPGSVSSTDAFISLGEKRVCLLGDVWDLNLDAEKPDLKLSAYTGDCGRMNIKTDFPGFDDVSLKVSLKRKKKRSYYHQTFMAKEVSCKIPVEQYFWSKFGVYLKKEGRVVAEVNYGIYKPKVKKDETFRIELGCNPPQISVVVSKKGNQLNIGRKLEPEKDGLTLYDMSLYDKNGTKKPIPAPAVEVRTVEGDKLIASGNMEYG